MSEKSYRIVKTVFVLVLIQSFFCSAQNVINPADGSWSNRQILVLDVPAGSGAYYSLSGNDPESSGFAYDGPVLLDVDGDVLLKVAIVNASGGKYTKDIIYTVKKTPYPESAEQYEFVRNVVEAGIIDYTAGDTFKIPSSLEYSFSPLSGSFEKGTEIRISDKAVFSRYLPCTVTDKNGSWRFILHVNPVMTGVFSRRDVPFEVSGWETVSFSNKKFIYKIDDGWWQQPKLPVKIDRTKNHMISWQPVDFSSENPVKFFVLPPKPEIKKETDITGAVSVSYSGEPGYKFGIIDNAGNVSELYESFRIDTFQGDVYAGKCRTGVFYDSVYQGDFVIDYKVNKRLPQKPVIISSAVNNFSRRLVTLNIQSAPGSDLYVSVAGPVIVDSENLSGDVLFNFQKDDFKKVSAGKFILHPSNDGAVAYKVSAYSEDSNRNRSNTAEYSVVIDTCNYYVVSGTAFDSEAVVSAADGTNDRPYSSFEQILPFINENRFVNIILDGELVMPERSVAVSSNLQITGRKDARLILPAKSSVIVRNSSFVVSDCVISYASGKSDGAESEISTNLFQIERGVLDFNNVEFSASFSRSGTVINSENSVVTIKDSGITASAESYASVIASVGSKISIKRSAVTTVAGTCINFSAQGGLFELRSSACKVVGVMGRIAELFDTQSSITDNDFNADLKKPRPSNNSIYTDSKNVSLEYRGNKESGF